MVAKRQSATIWGSAAKDDRPRLLIISNFWPTRTNPISGIFMVQRTAALVRLGYALDVVVRVRPGGRGRLLLPVELGLPAAHVALNPVSAPFLPERSAWASRLNMVIAGFCIRRTLKNRRLAAHFSGCFLHGLTSFSLSAPRWNHLLNCPLVVVLHGISRQVSPESGIITRRQVRNTVKQAQRVVLVGSPLKAYAEEIGVSANKIIVIPNGTDAPTVPNKTVDDPPASPERMPVILSVANLTAIKGVDQTLMALARLVNFDWEYRIVGDGPERAKLETLSRTLGLVERATFLGRLSYSQTMAEMSNCDIFCLPSWREAFGTVYLEAMIREKPLIGCLGNGPEDFVQHGHDGLLVPPQDLDELVRALNGLLGDPQLRNTLGVNAGTTARRFTWDSNARKMVALLTA